MGQHFQVILAESITSSNINSSPLFGPVHSQSSQNVCHHFPVRCPAQGPSECEKSPAFSWRERRLHSSKEELFCVSVSGCAPCSQATCPALEQEAGHHQGDFN